MSEKITVLPLEKMAMRLQHHPDSKKAYLAIGYGDNRGAYQFIFLREEDFPADGSCLRFSEIPELALQKEEEFRRRRDAQKISESELP